MRSTQKMVCYHRWFLCAHKIVNEYLCAHKNMLYSIIAILLMLNICGLVLFLHLCYCGVLGFAYLCIVRHKQTQINIYIS